MTEAPARIVLTARLTLRPFRPDDEPAYAAIRSNPEVARYLAGGVAGAAEGAAKAAALVPAFAAMWDDEPGYGPWAVEERATGRLLGHLGLRRLEELGGRTELLYALDPSAQGQGYAIEGAQAALGHAFETLGLMEVIALALPENRRSLKVMERAGMTKRDGLVEVFGVRAVFADIDRERFEARRPRR